MLFHGIAELVVMEVARTLTVAAVVAIAAASSVAVVVVAAAVSPAEADFEVTRKTKGCWNQVMINERDPV
jgi:hypothetical protein